MASPVYVLIFLAFIVAITQSVTFENSNEWDVERSSVNPLSYTDEEHYPPEWTTESPVLRSSRRRKTCPANEHFTRCNANCEKTCDNYNKPIPCPRLCIWGCICDLGLVRGPDKKCIKPTECPNKPHAEAQHLWPIPIPLICGQNEVLDACPSTCPDDCNNFRNKDRKCMKLCIPSCVCKDGYVRSHDGKCIKPYECHKEKNFCPSGEEYSPCLSHCESNCINGEENKNNCQRDSRLCVPGCTCKAGLVRGPEGTCIYSTECPTTPPKEPPTKVCPENELYDECKAACQRNCSNIDSALPCPKICQPGCVCKESMIRGKYGKCVETAECPEEEYSPDSYVTLNPTPYSDTNYHHSEWETKYPPISDTENWQFEEIPPILHEKPSHECPPLHRWVPCAGHCGRNCSNKDDEDFSCRPVCIPGCICEEGLVKGPNGKCIEKDQCPKNSNLEGDSYVTLNPPPYTDDDYLIPESMTETSAISETKNSQLEENEKNLHSNQLPFITCPKDEYRELCPSTCPDDCNNYKDTKRKCLKICIPACLCKKGFVRGPKGKCIKPTECPGDKKDDCKKDEIFSKCHGNCEKNCSNWAFDLICPQVCVSGCVCRPGRIRGPDGKCILWSQCPRSSSRYPGLLSTETSQPIKYAENNRLTFSDYAGCPKDEECSLSCRDYGHRYGHCTGRNNLVCSCYIENSENVEEIHEEFSASNDPCPNENECRSLCRRFDQNSVGQCSGPNNMSCICHG